MAKKEKRPSLFARPKKLTVAELKDVVAGHIRRGDGLREWLEQLDAIDRQILDTPSEDWNVDDGDEQDVKYDAKIRRGLTQGILARLGDERANEWMKRALVDAITLGMHVSRIDVRPFERAIITGSDTIEGAIRGGKLRKLLTVEQDAEMVDRIEDLIKGGEEPTPAQKIAAKEFGVSATTAFRTHKRFQSGH